jgi:small-conductance mechanosensitive channel
MRGVWPQTSAWTRISELLKFELWSTRGTPVTLGATVLFAVTVLLSIAIGRALRSFIVGVVQRRAVKADTGTAYALGRIAQYSVVALGVLFGLENAGISVSTFAAFGALFAVGLGLGVQNIAQNFISGLILLIERPIKKGDSVSVGNVQGTVDSIAIRATRLITADQVAVIVPNSKFIAEVVENSSEPTRQRRHKLAVRTSYAADPAQVEQLLLQSAVHEGVDLEPAPSVLLEAFGDTGLEFQLWLWVSEPAPAGKICSDVRKAVLTAFRSAGIEIPVAALSAVGPAKLPPASSKTS